MRFEQWTGNGSYGRWEDDRFGLPSYVFAPGGSRHPVTAQTTEPAVKHYPWHQVGNLRVTATAHEEGFLQLYNADRGMCCITPWQPMLGLFGAGLAALNYPGEKTLLLRREMLPAGALESVRFGMGYAEYRFIVRGLEITALHWAPEGDAPLIVSEFSFSAGGGAVLPESISAFFSVGYWFIDMDPICSGTDRKRYGPPPVGSLLSFLSGSLLSPLNLSTDHRRAKFARKCSYNIEMNNGVRVTPVKAGSGVFNPEVEETRQKHAMTFFCCPAGERAEISAADSRQVFDKDGSLRDSNSTAWKHAASLSIPHPVVVKVDFPLSEKGSSRVVWGYGEKQAMESLPEEFASESIEKSHDVAASKLCRFSVPGLEWVEREWKWHSYYLRSSSLYDSYFQAHWPRQGSAYLYIQGIDGALRDNALCAVPLCYIDPFLAKETIEAALRLTHQSGRVQYGVYGYGKAAGFGLHDRPSDLTMAFLWMLTEYIFATRDFDFLDCEYAFYPRSLGKSRTVRTQICVSCNYLMDEIGTGPNGLLHVGTGDWNDPLQLHVKSRSAMIARGESVYNTAMALYVLPRAAELLDTWEADCAGRLREFIAGLRKALDKQWNGKWLNRVWDGEGRALGVNSLYLEHHTWALIADALGMDRKRAIADVIHEKLDAPSPVGATILDPPRRVKLNIIPKGWDTNGGVWHAPNMLLTWGYGKVNREMARRSLLKSSLAAHAEAYPDIWYGIWSGPDSYNAHYAEYPGETFFHFTPMADFPVMNVNAHSNPLTAAIKTCGIEPSLKGFVIEPLLPDEEFLLDTLLLYLKRTPNSLEFEYRSVSASEGIEFEVRDALCGADGARLYCHGTEAAFERISAAAIKFTASPGSDGKILWKIEA